MTVDGSNSIQLISANTFISIVFFPLFCLIDKEWKKSSQVDRCTKTRKTLTCASISIPHDKEKWQTEEEWASLDTLISLRRSLSTPQHRVISYYNDPSTYIRSRYVMTVLLHSLWTNGQMRTVACFHLIKVKPFSLVYASFGCRPSIDIYTIPDTEPPKYPNNSRTTRFGSFNI